MYSTKIIGTGSVLPTIKKTNRAFWKNSFFNKDHLPIEKTSEAITAKFEEVAGITERRVAEKGVNTSDLGTQSARLAIQSSGIDPETFGFRVRRHSSYTTGPPPPACLCHIRKNLIVSPKTE